MLLVASALHYWGYKVAEHGLPIGTQDYLVVVLLVEQTFGYGLIIANLYSCVGKPHEKS